MSNDVENVDKAQVFKDAKTRLTNIIVNGVVSEMFECLFFAGVEKQAQDLGNAMFAVTVSKKGPILLYNPYAVMKMSDDEILFALEHELYHLIFEHFLRSFDMSAELNMQFSEFMQTVAPFSDVVVNDWAVRSHKVSGEFWNNLLTYDSDTVKNMSITRGDDTFEKVARKVKKHIDENGKDSIQKSINVIVVKSDGTVQKGSGQGKITSAVSEVDQQESEAQREQIAKQIEEASKQAGNVPREIRSLIEELVEDATPKRRALTGWELFRYMLVGERANGKDKERSLGRLNRRTLIPPGYKPEGAYVGLLIVDESGSVSDNDIQIAQEISQLMLQTANDKLYILPYDTEPGELREISDTKTYERTRGGGTNFEDMFTNDVVKGLDYDIAIIITDGFAMKYPSTPSGRPEIWLFVDSNGYNEWKRDYGVGVGIIV